MRTESLYVEGGVVQRVCYECVCCVRVVFASVCVVVSELVVVSEVLSECVRVCVCLVLGVLLVLFCTWRLVSHPIAGFIFYCVFSQ